MNGRSYFLRFTPLKPEDYNLKTVSVVFRMFDPTKLVVAREKASHEHYHIAIWGITRTSQNLRAYLKNVLEGQIYISGKEIEDQLRAIAYCLKDGDYYAQGLSIIEFLQASAISKRKIKYDDLLQEAEKEYDGDDKKFVRKLLEAHVKTNKKVYLPHIKAQLLLTKLKKEQYGTYREYLVEKIIDNM